MRTLITILMAVLFVALAAAEPVFAQDKIDFAPYMNMVTKEIKSHWHPPHSDESRRAVVYFLVRSNGKIVSLELKKPSGNSEMDRAALDAVADSEFLLLPPTGAPDPVEIEFAFDYNVYGASEIPSGDFSVSCAAPLAGSSQLGKTYMDALSRTVQSCWSRPRLAAPYCVVIDAQATPGAEFTAIKVNKSSGNSRIDEAAVVAINLAAPLDRLPSGAKKPAEVRFTFNQTLTHPAGDQGPALVDAEVKSAHGDADLLASILKDHAVRALDAEQYELAAKKFWEFSRVSRHYEPLEVDFVDSEYRAAAALASKEPARAANMCRAILYLQYGHKEARELLNKITHASSAAEHAEIAEKLLAEKNTVGAYVELGEAQAIKWNDERGAEMARLKMSTDSDFPAMIGIPPSDLTALKIDRTETGYAPTSTTNEAKAALANNEGVKKLNAGEYDGAVASFQQALEFRPDYRYAKENMAIAINNYALKQPPERAVHMLYNSLCVDPLNKTTHGNMNQALMCWRGGGGSAQGIVDTQRARVSTESSPIEHIKLGLAYELVDDWDNATAEYRAVKNDSTANALLDSVNERKNARAHAAGNRPIKSNPPMTAATANNDGVKFLNAKNYPAAIECFKRALAIESDYEYGRLNLVLAYKGYLATLFSNLCVKPFDPSINNNINTVRNELHDSGIAESEIVAEQFKRMTPHSAPKEHIAMGLAYELVDDWGRAKEQYEKAGDSAVASKLLRELPTRKAAKEKLSGINTP